MRNDSRRVFNTYMARVAELNGIDLADTDKSFAVIPSVQQKLETAMQESSEFLSKINVIPVTEQQGEKLGLSLSGPSAGRTNTADKERKTRDLTALGARGYHCTKTNFDTHLNYAKIDAWAKFKDFQIRVAKMLAQRQALDRICIGFNGISIAADTDIDANPLLQDVNKGWLQHLREEAPERVLGEGKAGGKLLIGKTGDYRNLDAAVFDARELLDPWHRNNPNLVVMLGSQLLHDKYFPLVNTDQAPSETMAADIVISQKRVGGLAAASAPFFPENAMLITTFDNLSVYWQEGARRRHIKENPARDRVEDFQSSNDAYVIEDVGQAVLVENIEIVEA
ncbi:phage major capsid protein, P2 family [Comamonas antarctica]|uniref:Phage major capsid protein, P2 family n=1 Tax=Comamonas antarctica TaxID=2743470 RepID=A0A6N1WYV8_9BURK|nr:phage major capsid protein, P2 family [Comamonas antarctica]QKV52394.1 phage major capsid protein, P2 family [Comamonas antarctica]